MEPPSKRSRRLIFKRDTFLTSCIHDQIPNLDVNAPSNIIPIDNLPKTFFEHTIEFHLIDVYTLCSSDVYSLCRNPNIPYWFILKFKDALNTFADVLTTYCDINVIDKLWDEFPWDLEYIEYNQSLTVEFFLKHHEIPWRIELVMMVLDWEEVEKKAPELFDNFIPEELFLFLCHNTKVNDYLFEKYYVNNVRYYTSIISKNLSISILNKYNVKIDKAYFKFNNSYRSVNV